MYVVVHLTPLLRLCFMTVGKSAYLAYPPPTGMECGALMFREKKEQKLNK